MADILVLIVVALFLLAALRGTVKHFKGEGPCCGGGSKCAVPSAEKKLKNPVIGKKIIRISGMHCQHCVNAVTASIDKIDGASAKVSLSGSRAVVSCDREIDEDALRKAVESAGYEVVSIES